MTECRHHSNLGSKSHVVDGMLGALMFAGAEVEENLAGSVHIGQRTTGDVDVAWTEVVQNETYVMTRVQQSTAHLQPTRPRG